MMLHKILFTLFFLVTTSSLFAHVSVTAEIDSTAIVIGEQAHISLKVVTDKNQTVKFPVFANKLIVPGLEVIDEKIVSTEEQDENNQKAITKVYSITAFDSALYFIPPFKVRVGQKVYSSKNLALKVLTMDVDTLHLDKFYGPKDIAEVPFSWNDWKGLFVLTLILLLLLFGFFYIALQLHNNRPIIRKFHVRPALPPHQWAINEINKINKEKEVIDDTKEYYTRLTDVLRSYIQKRYGFNAKEMTSSEIIDHLVKQQDKQSVSEIQQLFETADLAKFAKLHTQINENDENLLRAMDFIKATKIEVQEKPKQKVEVSPEIHRTRRSRLILKLINIALLTSAFIVMFFIGRSLYYMFF